jgi:hypothetical protein
VKDVVRRHDRGIRVQQGSFSMIIFSIKSQHDCTGRILIENGRFNMMLFLLLGSVFTE